MSRRIRRVLVATIAVGLLVSQGYTAQAAPIAALKQFKVPTASSRPFAITNGSDGNRWFTEGTEFTNAPPRLGRVTPAGDITEFDANCPFCILTDVVQGPAGILYLTSNNPILSRFNVAAGAFLAPIDIPNSSAVAGDMAARGDEVWFTDFNNDSLWRYNITADQFTQFPLQFQPSDVVIDAAGDAWFTATFENSVNRLDPATGAVESFPVPDGLSPRQIAIATDGQFWFTSRFVPQGVGRLDPATGVVTTFPTPSNPGPEGIAASPDGSIWFTQTTKGNIARIDNSGVITEAKVVRDCEPFGIIVAPNGDPWYTMMSANKIATLQLR
ncbi:MAG TPA: SMP-30/gluconolactonase/LRE family protein [Candidatus Limnocylindrales bacterium]|nr:SMP-30/gluconolactonase/LRE family protein [Candidatus Limnocylindrales bacterium]